MAPKNWNAKRVWSAQASRAKTVNKPSNPARMRRDCDFSAIDARLPKKMNSPISPMAPEFPQTKM